MASIFEHAATARNAVTARSLGRMRDDVLAAGGPKTKRARPLRRLNRPMSLTRLIAVSIALVALVAACDASAPTGSGVPEACPPVVVTGPDGQPVDLSGPWDGNDGGLYYMKQIDSCLWWSGVSNFATQYPGEEWIMTFKGHITSDGVIRGDFVDVKSGNPGSGTMTISIRVDQVENVGAVVNLYRTESTGHEIGVTFWQRATPSPSPEPTPAESSAPESAP